MDLVFQFPVHRVSAIINRFFGDWTYLINFARNILWDGPVKKWWKYVLHFLLNTAIIDAFLIMKESTNLPKRKYRQLDFRIALAQLLIGTFRTPKSTAGRRQQASSSTTHKFQKLTDKRSYCKNCSKSVLKKRKDTSYGCGLCDVHLCGKQCFALYHNYLHIEE